MAKSVGKEETQKHGHVVDDGRGEACYFVVHLHLSIHLCASTTFCSGSRGCGNTEIRAGKSGSEEERLGAKAQKKIAYV